MQLAPAILFHCVSDFLTTDQLFVDLDSPARAEENDRGTRLRNVTVFQCLIVPYHDKCVALPIFF